MVVSHYQIRASIAKIFFVVYSSHACVLLLLLLFYCCCCSSSYYLIIIIIVVVVVMCESIPAASIPPGKPPGIPRAFEKIVQMPGSAGNFCWQMHRPPFHLWWSNARPSSPSDQYTKFFWLPYFNKHNCFSSIELHKTGHEMSHSD